MPGGQLMGHSLYLWLDDKMPRKIYRRPSKNRSTFLMFQGHSELRPWVTIPGLLHLSEQMISGDVEEDFCNTTDTRGSVH